MKILQWLRDIPYRRGLKVAALQTKINVLTRELEECRQKKLDLLIKLITERGAKL